MCRDIARRVDTCVSVALFCHQLKACHQPLSPDVFSLFQRDDGGRAGTGHCVLKLKLNWGIGQLVLDQLWNGDYAAPSACRWQH